METLTAYKIDTGRRNIKHNKYNYEYGNVLSADPDYTNYWTDDEPLPETK